MVLLVDRMIGGYEDVEYYVWIVHFITVHRLLVGNGDLFPDRLLTSNK